MKEGAKEAATIAEACRRDAVITMLASDDAMEVVVFGEGGILESLPVGAIHISSSTISVGLAERLTAAHDVAGQGFVAAPVFGRPEIAAAGQLYVIAAGEQAALRTTASLLEAIGQKTFVVADTPRAAYLVKLSGNFLIGSVIEALGEAIALVGKGGIDAHQYVDILISTLFGAPIYKTRRTSGWRLPPPSVCAYRCRSPACCATAF